MTGPGVTPREFGLATGRRLKTEPISAEQAAKVARLLLCGVTQERPAAMTGRSAGPAVSASSPASAPPAAE
jgi:hypothetical protein